MQKSYEAQDWDHFFALAQIYRTRWPAHERMGVELLEGLALLKHCQFDIVHELIQNWKREKPRWKSQIATIEALAYSKIDYDLSASKTAQNFLWEYFNGKSKWKSTSAPNLIEANPHSLRVQVQNRCSSTTP